MGGVLVELGPLTEILGNDASLGEEEFWGRWLASPTVRAFEMGTCSVEIFGERLVAELGIAMDPGELIERFATWPKGLMDGAIAMVNELAQVVELGVLSNTNQLHWERQVDAEVMRSLFTKQYLSYQLGLAKPDADIFEHVVNDLGCDANTVLFLDDNQINVDGARAVGMSAELTKGVAEARSALVDYGLLS